MILEWARKSYCTRQFSGQSSVRCYSVGRRCEGYHPKATHSAKPHLVFHLHATWYIRNDLVHHDLNMPSVRSIRPFRLLYPALGCQVLGFGRHVTPIFIFTSVKTLQCGSLPNLRSRF